MNAIVPRLADGDGVWDDEITLTVALKENVYFHDGTPFNASAVKWNFDRLLLLTDNPLIEPILEEVIVEADYIVSFKLFSPYAPFKSLLCSPFAYMMSPSSTPQYRFLDPEHHVLVGTGPYQYISYDGESIEFEYWPYYYGGTPAIKQMTWKIYNDPYTKNQALLEGLIHMVDVPHPDFYGDFTDGIPHLLFGF
jgi:peptide/nickel transport system substrate-binding protein